MRAQSTGEVDYVELPDGEWYLMRPVIEGLCSYESLKNGTLDLADVAKMNDALDVKLENEERYRKANDKT